MEARSAENKLFVVSYFCCNWLVTNLIKMCHRLCTVTDLNDRYSGFEPAAQLLEDLCQQWLMLQFFSHLHNPDYRGLGDMSTEQHDQSRQISTPPMIKYTQTIDSRDTNTTIVTITCIKVGEGTFGRAF